MRTVCLPILTLLCLLCSGTLMAQWHTAYHGSDTTNEIKGISFYTPNEGYIAKYSSVAYTVDSGKTFVEKPITISNVNFNGYGVNLTFGFEAAGIKAFTKDKLIVYGDYGFEPSILISNDAGNTWKLVYHKNIDVNSTTYDNAVHDMHFINSTTGFALQNNEVIKTTDGGSTWVIQINAPNQGFTDLSFPDATVGYAVSPGRSYKIVISQGFWLAMSNSPFGAQKVSFVTPTTGYVYTNGYDGARIFKTTNGGTNWTPCGDPELFEPNADDMVFINETTGFICRGEYQIYKTTDSGKSWELCKGSNAFTYLGYGFNKLFFYNANLGWAGGYHDYLIKTITGGEPTIPKAVFKINKNTFCTDSKVQLENYSKSGYNYKWLLNGSQISTSYNSSYIADAAPWDTIQLVVSNGVDADTATSIIEAQAFGAFNFVSIPESDTVCSSKPYYILIPNSDPNTYYTASRNNQVEGYGYGNGGLLKLGISYHGNSALIQYRVDGRRTTACGVETKTAYHDIYFFTPFIDVNAVADTICSGITQYVKVTNSLIGYEYWIDSTKKVMGNGGELSIPVKINQRNLGWRDSWGNYTTIRYGIYAKHATWGCSNIFPRTEVTMVVRDPWAKMNVIDYEVTTGQKVTFSNSTSDADYYVWHVEGTGVVNNDNTERVPSNLSFTQPGRYKISLYATSKQGCSDTTTSTIQVYDAAFITSANMEVCAQDSLVSDHYYKPLDSYKDAAGNLYITGAKMKLHNRFSTKGLEGWFLIKKDRTGKVVWEKSNTISVGEGHIVSESVVADQFENVYIYGHLYRDRAGSPPYFVDTVFFGGGTSIAFVAKLNKNGRLVWMRTATNPTKDDSKWYPADITRPFAAGSLVIGKNNDLFLKLSSDFATFNYADTLIRSSRNETFLFHFNQDGKLLDNIRYPSKDATADRPAVNWDIYHHTPRMQWNNNGQLVFTTVLDSTVSINSIHGISLNFDTKKINTALFVYDTAQKKIVKILPLYKTGTQNGAALPLAFTTDVDGNYYAASYNRFKDTANPGPAGLVYPIDYANRTDASHKLKTVVSKFDATGNMVWEKLVDGLRPAGMFVMNDQLIIGGENYAVDFHKLAGHSYNSDIGKPYYHSNRDTLFIGYPTPLRKKLTYVSDMTGNNGKGISGGGGIDVVMMMMDKNGSNLQLKTWGSENDERLYSLAKDSCGNIWGLGQSNLKANASSTSFYDYSITSSTMMMWNWNYNNNCIAAPCTNVQSELRFDPATKNDKCVDSLARIYWSAANIDKVNISYSTNGANYTYLVQNYPADSLKIGYNPKEKNLKGYIHFKIEATDGSARDTITTFLASFPPKILLGRDTTLCYYDVMTVTAVEGPYKYKWNGGSWNEEITTINPPGAAGKVSVTVTDTLTGCSSVDFINVIRKPYFPQARIIADSSSNEKIVSTECGIKHEWRLNGNLLPDTGCVIYPKDTGLYSVATVKDGCVSSIYNGNWGYYRVTEIPRRVEWEKPSVTVKCFDSTYTVSWSTSPIVASLKISARKKTDATYTTVANSVSADSKTFKLQLKNMNLWGDLVFKIEDEAAANVYDTMHLLMELNPTFSLGKDTSICDGTPLVLKAPAGTGYTYQWSNGSNNPQIAILPQDSATYWLKVITANGCSRSDSIRVKTLAIPTPVIYRDTSNYIITDHCGFQHKWFLNGQEITGETDCRLLVKKGGIYTVQLINDKCVTELSDTLHMILEQKQAVEVGPNPTSNKLTVATVLTENNSTVKIEIIGENGYVYYSREYPNQMRGNFSTDINLSFINNGGLYFIRTTVGNQVNINKVVIIK